MCDPRAFGAIGDGLQDNSAAFNSAIQNCSHLELDFGSHQNVISWINISTSGLNMASHQWGKSPSTKCLTYKCHDLLSPKVSGSVKSLE